MRAVALVFDVFHDAREASMWCAPPYTLSIGSRHIQFCHLANEHHRHLHMHFDLINVRNVIRPNSMSTTYT